MGISIWQLAIILVIVMLLFGTKKLRNIGGDLGNAIKSFRSAVREGEEDKAAKEQAQLDDKAKSTVIEGEASREKDKA